MILAHQAEEQSFAKSLQFVMIEALSVYLLGRLVIF